MAHEKDEEPVKSGIKIVDRRRFDSDGEEKMEGKVAVVPEVKASVVQEVTAPESEKITAGYHDEEAASDDQPIADEPSSDISFGSFILSLATQALMQLGQLKPPDGMHLPVDPVAAKQTIDILGVLEKKTKGNLDAQEQRLLNDALQNLRVAFLRFR